MRRKILSTILALCMVMSMLPMTAFAAVSEGTLTVTANALETPKAGEVTLTITGKEAADTGKLYYQVAENADGQFTVNDPFIDTNNEWEEYTLTGGAENVPLSDVTNDYIVMAVYVEDVEGTATVKAVGTSDPIDDGTVLKSVAITGTAKVGQTLTATVQPTGAAAAYQWKADNTDISGATASTFVLTTDQLNKKITVEATGTTPYTGTVTSDETDAVAAADSPKTDVTDVAITLDTDGLKVGAALPQAETTAKVNLTTVWKDKDNQTVSETFKTAGTHTATITVEAQDGYVLAANVNYTLNGEAATATKNVLTVNNIDVAAATPSKTTISAVAVALNTAGLVEGDELPDATTETTGAKVATVWTDKDGKTVTTAEAAGEYTAAITVSVTDTDTYELAQDATYTLNNQPATLKNGVLPATATVAAKTYALTVNTPENGTVTTDPANTTALADGTKVTLTVTPTNTANYKVGAVTANGVEVKPTTADPTKYEVTIDKADVDVVVTFVAKDAVANTITVVANAEQGTATTGPADEAFAGVPVTVNAKPAIGFAVQAITVTYTDGDEEEQTITVDKANPTFNMPGFDVTVTVTFVEVKHAITFGNTTNGTMTVTAGDKAVATGDELREGTEITVTVEPNAEYQLETLTVGGVDVTANVQNGVYTFTLEEDTVIAATFAVKTYNVTVADNIANGTVTADVSKAAKDAVVTLSNTPAEEYILDKYTVTDADGKPVEVSADGKFTMPAKDVTVSATFKAIEYNITITSGANGDVKATVDGKEVTKAAKNAQVTLKIEAAEGYSLDALTVAGENVKDSVWNNEYTFTMPGSTVAVNATFAANVVTEAPKGDVADPAVTGLDTSTGTPDEQQFKSDVNDAVDGIAFDNTVLNEAAKQAVENTSVTTSDLTAVTTTLGGITDADTHLKTIKDAVEAAQDPDDGNNKLEGVNVVTQVYMDVQITAAAKGTSIEFTITPKAQTLLTTVDPTVAGAEPITVYNETDNGRTANAVKVGAPKNVPITAKTEVTLPLPDGFTQLKALWVEHLTDFYRGTVEDNVLKFTTNGFSPFKVYATDAAAGVVAKIGDNGYKTLAAAVTAADNDSKIEVLADVSSAINILVPDKAMTFTIEASDANYLPDKDEFKATTSDDWTVTVTPSNEGKTLTVKVEAKDPGPGPGPGPGGSSGGSSVSSNVATSGIKDGKVTVNPSNPKKGDTVTLTVSPNAGKQLSSITVTDKDGKTVELTKVDDTHYTFVMPDGKVTVNATFTDIPGEGEFTDVDKSAYYYDAVKWAVDKGITNGITATTFGPNNSCTRGQMVTFLWRAAGSPAATGTNSFSDVDSSAYYYNAVLWAVEKGITNGTTSTTFSPNATVNRGQTVTFLYRYAESPAATGDSSFTDVAADAFYADAVKWAVAEEITNGTSATTFAPSSNCTRGQIVTFLYRQMAE